MLAAAYDDIGLNPHALQLLDTRLRRLGFHLLRSAQIGNQRHMNQDRILVADLVLKLPDRF